MIRQPSRRRAPMSRTDCPVLTCRHVYLARNIHRFHNRRIRPRTMARWCVLLHVGAVQRSRRACRVVGRFQAWQLTFPQRQKSLNRFSARSAYAESCDDRGTPARRVCRARHVNPDSEVRPSEPGRADCRATARPIVFLQSAHRDKLPICTSDAAQAIIADCGRGEENRALVENDAVSGPIHAAIGDCCK
jgi:hypothetical protein